MLRAVLALVFLVLGAVALARGLYIQTELTRQLETGTMGFIRSWVLWSTTDGRELLAWYRQVTPWLIWGGTGALTLGLLLAVVPEKAPATPSHVPGEASGRSSRGKAAQTPRPRRKAGKP
jgi:hypothetical protein